MTVLRRIIASKKRHNDSKRKYTFDFKPYILVGDKSNRGSLVSSDKCMETRKESDVIDPVTYSHIGCEQFEGRYWWHVDGFHRMAENERMLHEGDAIIYRRTVFSPDSFMIVKSFDYQSDIAARGLIGIHRYSSTWYESSDFAPSFNYYRFATDKEIDGCLRRWTSVVDGTLRDFHMLRLLKAHPKYVKFLHCMVKY